MDTKFIIDRITHNEKVFREILTGIAGDQVHWKPEPDKWSMLEIVNHLYDEEQYDFRERVNASLENREAPPIDPQGWVKEKKYAERDYVSSVANFLLERERSIVWLHSLEGNGKKEFDWESKWTNPQFEMTAYGFLVNWLAHDYLHIRQINRMNYMYLKEKAGDTSLIYAGEW
jgi:hypothetical protein